MTPSVAIRLAQLLLLGLLLAPGAARAEGAFTARRVAIVVGANAPAPGRKPLRFAHQDARAVADVLRSQGGFAGEDVRLLFDPEPGEVLGALDAVLREAARSKSVNRYRGRSCRSERTWPANLSARAEIDREEGEFPYQIQAGLAGGIRIRFYLLYVQVGYVMDLLPSEVTFSSSEDRTSLDQPRPGLAAEAGFRVVKNFD
jgi:hypothetical protein